MILAALLLLCPQAGPVEFVHHPVDGQLYPRNAQDLGEVRIAGWVHQPGWQRMLVITERDGAPYTAQLQQLTYTSGGAGFDFRISIPAECHAYSFKAILLNGPITRQVAEVENVVAGDAFLIAGQSNAVAWDAYGEGLANLDQSPWVRSYGTASANVTTFAADHNWYRADGQTALAEGSVGAWGLRMGRLLVDRTGIPVVIINGAVGATWINLHLRNDLHPASVNNMYGRLLTRALRAGVADSVRAMIWHQGESDGANYLNYDSAFRDLHGDWLEDYPALEQVYMFQVREGCGQPSIELREVQRTLKDTLTPLQVMSTTAVPGHDGCHYPYVGYREFAHRITRLVGRDLYGSTLTQDIDAPDIDTAVYANPQQDAILLTFRDPDDALHFDPGAAADFELADGVAIVSGTVSNNTILLTLAGPSNSGWLAYNGHSMDGPWITNALGIGALTFKVAL